MQVFLNLKEFIYNCGVSLRTNSAIGHCLSHRGLRKRVKNQEVSYVYHIWRRLTLHRMHLRFIFARAHRRFRRVKFLSLFWRWVRETISVIQAEILNRVARGYLARKEAATIRMIHVSITRVQSRSRQWLARRVTHNIHVKHSWAAVEIQRITRGFFGRKRMGWRIEEYVARERLKLCKERESWDQSTAACLIQRSYRRYVAISAKVPARKRYLREASVLDEFLENAKQEEVERLIYIRALEHYYFKERKKIEVHKINENFTTKEKAKMRNRQWQRKLLQWRSMKRIHAECKAMGIEDKLSWCSSVWHRKIVSLLQNFEDDLRQCFSDPKVKPKEYRILKVEANKHLKHIFYETEQICGQKLERDEAFHEAINRVITERKAFEAARLESAMRENQVMMLNSLEREIDLENDREQDDARTQANKGAVVIQCLIRATFARVQLRSIARGIFFRVFDASQVACIYVNRQSLEIYETRPRALGPWNLKPVDQYIEISNTSRISIFFNPFTGNVQYKPSNLSSNHAVQPDRSQRVQSSICSEFCCHDECEHFSNACCDLLRQLL